MGSANSGGLAVASLQATTPNANLTQSVQLTFNAAAGTYDVVGVGTGNPVSQPYTPGQPIVINGWSMTLTGLPQTGDTITVGPTINVQASAGASNTGNLVVTNTQVQTPNANLLKPVTLTFNAAAGTFAVVGTGTGNPMAVPYTPGAPISYNGWAITVTGTPVTGDTISMGASSKNYLSTNSGNATALVNLRDMKLFDAAPLTDGYAAAISQVGVLAQSASFAASTSQSIATNAQTAKASVSGVNLDEEAAKLLQFQQAYQASAKVLQIAQTLFTSLISSFGP
jgi:flagellar hook-associated protein 1 FlgK